MTAATTKSATPATVASKKSPDASPDQIAQIQTLRESGYTVAMIAQKVGLSPRTVHRYLAAGGVKKGKLKQELIEQARQDVLNLILNDETVRYQAAHLLADNIAHSQNIRDIILKASQHLEATDPESAAVVMRAAAAASAALKNTSDMVRHSLPLDNLTAAPETLPELSVRVISNNEAKALMKDGAVEDSGLGEEGPALDEDAGRVILGED
ncbi:helix-turn-helix domain-containing protein [Methylobacillus methanolivorans]|uniref:Helix-turn-helix domain-containing protein n=1 Tax=Methylobacillus methanolivorans TaxID=1848927 RepID=A0ABW8GGY1_9PROT